MSIKIVSIERKGAKCARRDNYEPFLVPRGGELLDASTCPLPDHTWFIKNVGHRDMPDSITSLFEAIYEFDGYMTVFDDEAFPQYLFFDEATQLISPLTADNMVSENEQEWNMSFFRRLVRMFKLLGAFIRDWLQSKF